MARRKGHDPESMSSEEQRAQQVAVAQEYIELVGHTQRTWHIVRCGDKNTAAAMAMLQRLERMGYKRAHKELMCRGFEEYDGQDGIYVWAPPEVRAMHAERRQLADRAIQRTLNDSFAGTLGSLQSIQGNVKTSSVTDSSPTAGIQRAKADLSG